MIIEYQFCSVSVHTLLTVSPLLQGRSSASWELQLPWSLLVSLCHLLLIPACVCNGAALLVQTSTKIANASTLLCSCSFVGIGNKTLLSIRGAVSFENRLCHTGFGAAYGTAKSGVGIASMGVMRPELVMKSIVPVVMAGVLGIYGLIIAVIISTGSKHPRSLPMVLVWLLGKSQCTYRSVPE